MLVADVLGGSAFRYWDSPVWLLSDGCPGGGGLPPLVDRDGTFASGGSLSRAGVLVGSAERRPVRLPLGGRSDAPYLPGEALS